MANSKKDITTNEYFKKNMASSTFGGNPVKQGEVRYNEMGSQVVEGYTCKPVDYDPDKPIMHYKTLVVLCDDERCGKAGKPERASHLREIIKELGLSKGKNRIKVSRSGCYGACRYRQVCTINENTQANGFVPNNSLWLQHTHQYSDAKWKEIFTALSCNIELSTLLERDDFIQMQVYE